MVCVDMDLFIQVRNSEGFTSFLWFGSGLNLDRPVLCGIIPWFFGVLVILLIQGIRD